MGSILNEVVRPDMIPMFWSFADTGTIIEPESSSFGLLLGTFSTSRRHILSTRL
jgi:hypothetical protein